MVDQASQAWWQRAIGRLVSFSLTLAVIVGAVAAVVLGSSELANRAAAAGVTETAEPTPVDVIELETVEGFNVAREFVGQVEAAASVVLSFELNGRLSELSVREGTEVEAGAVLARLDTALLDAEQDRLEASRSATHAQLDLAETRLSRAQALLSDGHVSQDAMDLALAARDELASRVMEIDAALDAVAINLEKSVLHAPFEGRVGELNVDGGETMNPGAPVLTLIETAAPEVRVGLPLSVDAEVLERVSIEIDGEVFAASLAQVRPDIDPVTRTRTALFTLQTDDMPTFGQTATLTLETRIGAPGAWVPIDALQEGVGGGWNLLVVDGDVVRAAMVEVLHADETQAYVIGTFTPGARMIRTGAHRVVPGQVVQVLAAAE